MNNRAKCKLCSSIIESFHRYDYVTCKCGEISISGGRDVLECSAKNFANFLRVDEMGNEVEVKLVDKSQSSSMNIVQEPERLSRKDMINMLESMTKNLENLPQNAMNLSISHYDLYSFMAVVVSIFKEDNLS